MLYNPTTGKVKDRFTHTHTQRETERELGEGRKRVKKREWMCEGGRGGRGWGDVLDDLAFPLLGDRERDAARGEHLLENDQRRAEIRVAPFAEAPFDLRGQLGEAWEMGRGGVGGMRVRGRNLRAVAPRTNQNSITQTNTHT